MLTHILPDLIYTISLTHICRAVHYLPCPAMMDKCFGVIADIQHADVEDGYDFRYRMGKLNLRGL